MSWFILLVLLGAGGTAAYVLVIKRAEATERDAPAGGPATNDVPTGGSPAPDGAQLPDLQFPRPALTSAEWVKTSTDVIERAGAPQLATSELHVVADYVKGVASLETTMSDSDAPVFGYVTEDHQYEPGSTFGAPWKRAPRTRDPDVPGVQMPESLEVYQDVIVPEVRATATNVTVTSAVIAGVATTTFSFDVDMRNTVAGSDDQYVGGEASRFVGRMEVTIDAAGLVRRWSFELDEDEVRLAVAQGLERMPVRFGTELLSVNTPVEVNVPTEFVDAAVPVPTTPPLVVPSPTAGDGEGRLADEVCLVEQRTLEVAAEAWYLMTGSMTPPSEAQLVTDGLLREESALMDIVDGTIVGAPITRCA